ncbi:hypothetical protein D3C75_1368560 [compost metagenome]
MLRNHLHRLVQLEAAIAALAAKDIAGMTNAVHPDQRFVGIFKITINEHARLLSISKLH